MFVIIYVFGSLFAEGVPDPRIEPNLCFKKSEISSLTDYLAVDILPPMEICDLTHTISMERFVELLKIVRSVGKEKNRQLSLIFVPQDCETKERCRSLAHKIVDEWRRKYQKPVTNSLILMTEDGFVADVDIGAKRSKISKERLIKKMFSTKKCSDEDEKIDNVMTYFKKRPVNAIHKLFLALTNVNNAMKGIPSIILFLTIITSIRLASKDISSNINWIESERRDLLDGNTQKHPEIFTFCPCCYRSYRKKFCEYINCFKRMYAAHCFGRAIEDNSIRPAILEKMNHFDENSSTCVIEFDPSFHNIRKSQLIGKQVHLGVKEDFFEKLNVVTIASCGHMVHRRCLRKWIRKHGYMCPVCREPIDKNPNHQRSASSSSSSSSSDDNTASNSNTCSCEDGCNFELERKETHSIEVKEKDDNDMMVINRENQKECSNNPSSSALSPASMQNPSDIESNSLSLHVNNIPSSFIRLNRPNFITDTSFIPPSTLELHEIENIFDQRLWYYKRIPSSVRQRIIRILEFIKYYLLVFHVDWFLYFA
ncbi:uncharacterized protein MONOS_13706 [Monocercomonoides exilis]|uniref:uncharacterized protein n=1 Tax=Monocercomonoides exilis TaxID=2049356 RepID=UPI00355A9DF9|nr:hypothetical protein MONOS_13706 [Monocercomonoides exilis]|eukprot:MONOS_13706.1-p1 / transcript=MONOS_13706.1 / gene=MONOS_13706 / organism=Monocercomonoides_exilis_PA203 / gene_product=unspecified product / transcript_product=unspecified product / location=Mono_scaffold00868:10627-12854(-) / protein_length=538 / sequence_SO=supercontig / SO=protein_coding / is_pseudo=false